MKIQILSGQHKGKTGEMRGDLAERKRTLGKDGKVQVWIPGQKLPTLIRTKHLTIDPVFDGEQLSLKIIHRCPKCGVDGCYLFH